MEKYYKVEKEYDRYYLCTDERHIRECFSKALYKPDEDGFIVIKETDSNKNDTHTDQTKVNRNFNPGKLNWRNKNERNKRS